jgi:hypothetical protein
LLSNIKWVNLYRYATAARQVFSLEEAEERMERRSRNATTTSRWLEKAKVGLHKETSVYPELQSPWFQPLNMKCDILVTNFAFIFNLYRCTKGKGGEDDGLSDSEGSRDMKAEAASSDDEVGDWAVQAVNPDVTHSA